MSALTMLARGAVSGIWKITAVALVALLLAVLGAAGTGWWLLAGARDQAQAALAKEQGVSAGLRGAIAAQNRAVDALAAAKVAADARGLSAQQLAAANGKRFDGALQRLAGARAATCAEAMPAVNKLLEAIQ